MARNSEQLIQRLSDLPTMRRAAQLAALIILRIGQEIKNPQARIASFSSKVKLNLKEEIDRAKKELQKKS